MLTTTSLETARARRIVAALSRCIEVCLDCERSFDVASAGVRNKTLRAIFGLYGLQRADFVRALHAEMDALGYAYEHDAPWMTHHHHGTEAILLVTGHNDDAVVTECMRNERAALHVYEGLVHHSDVFPERTLVLLTHQRDALAAALHEMKHRLVFPAVDEVG